MGTEGRGRRACAGLPCTGNLCWTRFFSAATRLLARGAAAAGYAVFFCFGSMAMSKVQSTRWPVPLGTFSLHDASTDPLTAWLGRRGLVWVVLPPRSALALTSWPSRRVRELKKIESISWSTPSRLAEPSGARETRLCTSVCPCKVQNRARFCAELHICLAHDFSLKHTARRAHACTR